MQNSSEDISVLIYCNFWVKKTIPTHENSLFINLIQTFLMNKASKLFYL